MSDEERRGSLPPFFSEARSSCVLRSENTHDSDVFFSLQKGEVCSFFWWETRSLLRVSSLCVACAVSRCLGFLSRGILFEIKVKMLPFKPRKGRKVAFSDLVLRGRLRMGNNILYIIENVFEIEYKYMDYITSDKFCLCDDSILGMSDILRDDGHPND